MNKDVIYIEPEDDITDIITKIEKAKNKIVALVPPKKAGVFRSIVNIKLIAKAGAGAGKTVVIVTTDPSIMKLAAATKIPVTENLQSAPSVPKEVEEKAAEKTAEKDSEKASEKDSGKVSEKAEKSAEKSEKSDAEEAEDADEEADAETGVKKMTKAEIEAKEEAVFEAIRRAEKKSIRIKDESDDDDSDDNDGSDDEKDDADDDVKALKKQKSKKNHGKKEAKGWFGRRKVTLIMSGIVSVALVVALVWAFAFAPAVDVLVTIKTDQKNFSENVTFVEKLTDEKAADGKFYLDEKKIEDVKEVAFEATGKKNVGEKAKGELVVYTYFKVKGNVPIVTGTTFKIGGGDLTYVADETVTLAWDEKDMKVCENSASATIVTSGCLISARIKVSAEEGGSKYNIGPSTTGWNAPLNSKVAVYSDKAIEGGTDKYITVVQQSDVEKAKESLGSTAESSNKAKLLATIAENNFVLDETFSQETSKAVATPGVDEEVAEGVKPTLKTTTTASIWVVDKVKLEEFVEAKVKLEDNQKVYKIQDVYLESFLETEAGYSAKLKAQYFIGPKITEAELVEKILGKGLGDARREINDIYGVSDVNMNASYPWVMAVPGDSNKVTVTFKVED